MANTRRSAVQFDKRVSNILDTAYWRNRYAVSSLMDTAYWLSEQVRIAEGTMMLGFALNTLTQQAQMSLKRIASLAIRMRSFSDPTAQNVDPMIGEIEGMRLRGACRDSRA
ncbi:hypothetical protein Tco_1247120 [Tanacetum coccineum]